MTPHRQSGFTLVEFVVAIVFIAVVLGPFLVFVVRIQDLNNAMGQQARQEAWRSFNDQALAAGIDPSRVAALRSTINPAVPAVPGEAIAWADVPALPGMVRLQPLHTAFEVGATEPRPAGAGYQLGAGASVVARTTPTAPLAPIVMPMPTMTPANGTVISVAVLTPTTPGAPSSTEIKAAAATGTRVIAIFNQPSGRVEGPASAQRTVTAVELANRVNGSAWTEYPGDNVAGDRTMILGDGRARWFVTRADGRQQIYEPSPPVAFSYQISLGAPVLIRNGVQYEVGATVAFDYAGYQDVQRGVTSLKIDFPSEVKAAFGNAWGSLSIGFRWTFEDVAGPFSGELTPFFQPEMLSLWGDSAGVVAAAVAPSGAAAETASWTLVRSKTALDVPRLTQGADAAGFFAPGQLEFSAPPGPDGAPLGRLSFESGSNVSTGPTLSLVVIP